MKKTLDFYTLSFFKILMNSRAIFGVSMAAVFAFTMMSNPVFAVSSNLRIASVDGFSITVEGPNPGVVEESHDIVVYAFFTDKKGKSPDSFVAYVAATHSSFADDPEQDDDIKALHAHKAELNNTSLCVQAISENPDVAVEGSTVSIPDAKGNVVGWVIAAYDITDAGICPTEVYDAIL